MIEFLLKLDKFANGLIGGDPRETISSRMARNMHKEPWAMMGCKLLEILFFDKDHCEESRQRLNNLKTNDHPVFFMLVTLVLFAALIWAITQIVNYFS